MANCLKYQTCMRNCTNISTLCYCFLLFGGLLSLPETIFTLLFYFFVPVLNLFVNVILIIRVWKNQKMGNFTKKQPIYFSWIMLICSGIFFAHIFCFIVLQIWLFGSVETYYLVIVIGLIVSCLNHKYIDP